MLALLLATVVATTPADVAFERLYNADFAGAQKVINEALRQEPANAFYYAVRAAAYSFGEMNRLHILETDFFLDDENLSSKEKLKPDPAVRAALYADVAQARKLASARLAVTPDDRDALFTMCMAASVITDYTGAWSSGVNGAASSSSPRSMSMPRNCSLSIPPSWTPI